MPEVFSIDQNCHPLWDVPPKLQALARAGRRARHFIEDIDVAFTSLGASPGSGLRLERERFYRSGGQDWGAAMFYCEFLGRLPVEIRDFEPLTGMTTKALAGRIKRSVDQLYDEFSSSDNWQLIGPSYVGDRQHHRVVGDLDVEEIEPFLRRLIERAKADVLRSFPDPDCRDRTEKWFHQELRRVEAMLADLRDGKLVDLYHEWMDAFTPLASVSLESTSSLFALDDGNGRMDLLQPFVRDYDQFASLYNEAIVESGESLRPLDVKNGELPFFATTTHQDHRVRTGVYLRDGELFAGERSFRLDRDGGLPLEKMRESGICCLSGKAILLVIQARAGGAGEPLALPYRGSLYMPAAHALTRKLTDAGVLGAELAPILRVRLHLMDQLRTLETTIHLPDHLAEAMGAEAIPARRLGENWRDLANEAEKRLERFRDERQREAWQRETCPELTGRLDELDRRRRELAEQDPKGEEIRRLSKEYGKLEVDLVDRTLRQIHRDWQVSRIDYWDSRGAIIPWAVALGGEAFYDRMLDEAEIYEERAEDQDR